MLAAVVRVASLTAWWAYEAQCYEAQCYEAQPNADEALSDGDWNEQGFVDPDAIAMQGSKARDTKAKINSS
jgi:hypothetical protein